MQNAGHERSGYAAPRVSVAELCWQQMRDVARRACVAHAQGRGLEAHRVTAMELTPLVERWSAICPLGTADKKLLLKALLDEERERAMQHRDAAPVDDLPLPAPSPAAASQRTTVFGPAQIRRIDEKPAPEGRIPISDVSGMIDAALRMRDRLFSSARQPAGTASH